MIYNNNKKLKTTTKNHKIVGPRKNFPPSSIYHQPQKGPGLGHTEVNEAGNVSFSVVTDILKVDFFLRGQNFSLESLRKKKCKKYW